MAATSMEAPRIVVTNGMLSSTANRRIMFPSRTAPPDTVGTFTMKLTFSTHQVKSVGVLALCDAVDGGDRHLVPSQHIGCSLRRVQG